MTIISIFKIVTNPYKTLSWLLAVTFLPLLGMFLFAIFGRNVKKDWSLNHNKPFYNTHTEYISPFLESHPKFRLLELLRKNSSASLSYNKTIDILVQGEITYDSLLSSISSAKHTIFIEYYIIEEGSVLRRLLDILKSKAEEGVIIKIIYDGFGSYELDKNIFEALVEVGVQIKAYVPFGVYRYLKYLNYRNHRKIVIIDTDISYIGGMNLTDKYLKGNDSGKLWKDITLRIHGEATKDIMRIFLCDWYNAGGIHDIDDKVLIKSETTAELTPVQIVSSGPDSEYMGIMHEYFTLITDASDYVYIITPYFVPTQTIVTALKTSALSGIDVRLMLPYQSDSRWLKYCTFTFIKELLSAGVRVYLYHDGFLHGKVMFIDDKVLSVGSANIDERSFSSNFEVNAVIYNDVLTEQMKAHFFSELEDSEELLLSNFDSRHDRNRVLESIARLTSPLL